MPRPRSLLYLVNNPPLDLAPDEAHYWDWSRHLDWSYYSKGPLVAYLIAASCSLVGPWSIAHTGRPDVRHPPARGDLRQRIAGQPVPADRAGLRPARLALAVVGIALTLPLIAAGSTLMTIDAPYCCCWGWALVLAYQAAFRGWRWAWPLAGLYVGPASWPSTRWSCSSPRWACSC